VQFSYSDTLIVGKVRLVSKFGNESSTVADYESGESFSDEFDVIIRIFGLNETKLNFNPALLLNRDTQFVGQMIPSNNLEELIKETTEGYDEFINSTDYDVTDKTIEIGERQAGNYRQLFTYVKINKCTKSILKVISGL